MSYGIAIVGLNGSGESTLGHTIVFDEDYEKLCPWIKPEPVGKTWPTEMTDAVVEVLECEKDNREQRRKKREEREINSGSQE